MNNASIREYFLSQLSQVETKARDLANVQDGDVRRLKGFSVTHELLSILIAVESDMEARELITSIADLCWEAETNVTPFLNNQRVPKNDKGDDKDAETTTNNDTGVSRG